MRHQKTRHKLSRSASHRKALLANLCKEVIEHERIRTTEAKAKAVKPEIEQSVMNGAGAAAANGGPMHDILIEELELGVRSYNCLKRAGIQTVGDLVSKSEGELAAIPNFGKKSIDEVVETLSQRGLSLRSD